MLKELSIRNLAIIEEQRISFAPGLNVLSGETGAGKSIVLSALQLVLGARASVDLIRHGADRMEVQAIFDLAAAPANVWEELPEIAQLDVDGGRETASASDLEVGIVRELSRSGRNRVFINGRVATVTVLRELCGQLISICGQNEHTRLLEPHYHYVLLDRYANNERLLTEYGDKFSELKKLKKNLQDHEQRTAQRARREAELRFIVEELGQLELHAELRSELEAQVNRLGNVERLREYSAVVENHLEGTVAQSLVDVAHALEQITKLDPAEGEQLQRSFALVQDAVSELETEVGRYHGQLELDDGALESLRERLADVARLERKYRCDSAGLVELHRSSQAELEQIVDEVGVEELRAAVVELEQECVRVAAQLSKRRVAAGQRLSKAVERELAELNMGEARLKLAISQTELRERGSDEIELLIATNKGEPFKVLRQVASGGELSRILLVLKKILNDRHGVNVLVFDEIDSGISGAVARAVGEKLAALSCGAQVLCITHLAQVASLADHHLFIQKLSEDRTRASVAVLSEEQRVEEIARMLGGYKVSRATRESARELLASKY